MVVYVCRSPGKPREIAAIGRKFAEVAMILVQPFFVAETGVELGGARIQQRITPWTERGIPVKSPSHLLSDELHRGLWR